MITSKTNELIKHIKSLHQKSNRDESGEFIIEGPKVIKEAIVEKADIRKIIICEEILGDEAKNFASADVEYVSKNVFEYISDTKTPQGILAILNKKALNDDLSDTILALDTVQDPGNVGTIIRTLDCTGIRTLLLSKGSADVYSPKVTRSTMGAIFRINIYDDVELVTKLNLLKTDGYKIIITSLDAKNNLFDFVFPKKCVIVIGNEANGVSKEVQNLADEKIIIPMDGNTESLNAGVAASIIAYEVYRKK